MPNSPILGLLRFKVHQLHLDGRRYLLLPKLNGRQIEILANRLAESGFDVQTGEVLKARSRKGTIYLSASGLSWSSLDSSDVLLPAIPDILAVQKVKVPLPELKGKYVRTGSEATTTLYLSPRIESASLWEKMRASGDCGLAPDEHAVISFLINQAGGRCGMLTDYPADDATPRIYGRKRYFDSRLDCDEALSTLRAVGERRSRNSYIRRDGTVLFESYHAIHRRDWLELFAELGEWCYYVPV